MEEKTYNGWTNYETWAVSLWLENDQGSYEYWRKQAREGRRGVLNPRQLQDVFWSKAEAAILTLADQLKDEIEEASPLAEASLYSDLLSAALSEVNWREIAGSMLDALPAEETDESERDEADAENAEEPEEKEQPETVGQGNHPRVLFRGPDVPRARPAEKLYSYTPKTPVRGALKGTSPLIVRFVSIIGTPRRRAGRRTM
jgi:hypothetical protein